MGAVYRARPGSRVVVRETRGGRRLEIAGTFASYWNPDRGTTGIVWDALALPLVARPRGSRRSVLVLGLGGGSVVRVARELAPEARIVAVEIDREVVRAARRWFGLDGLGVEVHEADAGEFLARSRGRFDAIVEDVFVGGRRNLRKPAWLPEPGLGRAARRLVPGGVLVSNALDEASDLRRALRAHFPRVVDIGVAGYDNRILVGGPTSLDAHALRAAARAEPRLAATLPQLRFRTV